MNRIPRLLRAALALFCLLGFGSFLSHAVLAQTTTVTASALKIGGYPISSGSIYITAVGPFGQPIVYADATGAQNGPSSIACKVLNGAITGAITETGSVSGPCVVPDATQTVPANLLYSIQVQDQSVGLRTSGTSYTLSAVAGVSGSTWALDHYAPPGSYPSTQQVQAWQGTAVPTSCVAPSQFTLLPGGAFYNCVGGVYALVTGAGGATGPAGAVGPAGATGAAGATGPAGATGAAGLAGATGPAGATGATGATGAAGTSVSAIPTPPAGAQVFSDINNTAATFTGGGAWTGDSADAGGGAGTCTVTDVSSPSLSGHALQLSVSSTVSTSPANCLGYRHIGCPTLAGGCSPVTDLHLLEEYDVYIPAADVGIQAVENDPDMYDTSNEYFNSRQCDVATGMWRLWNMSTVAWMTTSYPCTASFLSQRGTWHHVREYTIFSRGSVQSIYRAFELDGVTVWPNLNQAFSAKANGGAATLNVELQMDLNSAAGTATQTLLIDNLTLTVWLG